MANACNVSTNKIVEILTNSNDQCCIPLLILYLLLLYYFEREDIDTYFLHNAEIGLQNFSVTYGSSFISVPFFFFNSNL